MPNQYSPNRMSDCHPERPHSAHGLCRQCYAAQWARDARKRDPEKTRAIARLNAKRDRTRKPDWFRQHKAAYYQRNRDAIRERQQTRKLDPVLNKRRQARYRDTHRNEIQVAERVRYHADLEASRARARTNTHAHEARKRERFVEKVDVAVLYQRDRGICQICRQPCSWEDRSIDHSLPLARGGEHSYRNTQLAHVRCNKGRRDRGPAQLRMLG